MDHEPAAPAPTAAMAASRSRPALYTEEALGRQTVWTGEVVAHTARFGGGGGSLVGVEESFDTANHVGGD